MRVGWVAGERTLENFGRMLNPLAIGLMDELVELVVICPAGVDLGVFPSPPTEALRHGRLRWWGFETGAVESLSAELKSRKVQLLHALEAATVPLTRKLAAWSGLRYVVSSLGLGDGRRLRTLDDQVVAVLAGSGPVCSELRARRVAAVEKIQIVRPGVHHVDQAACFSDSGKSVSIVATGRMDDFAAFDAVLRSFAELRCRKYDCAFFMIGNGRAEKRLRAQAERLSLRKELTFIDRLPAVQMPDVFKAADLFISPTAGRQIDLLPLLAMAAGVPVLAAPDRSCDFLIDGRTATLFARGDAAELTMKLVALLDDKAAAREIADSALAHVREHHSPTDMVAAVARIYRQAIL